MDDIKGVKLDRFYNPIPQNEELYLDEFLENLTEVVELNKSGKLSDELAHILIKVFFSKEIKEQTKSTLRFGSRVNTEKRTLLLDITSKKSYAR